VVSAHSTNNILHILLAQAKNGEKTVLEIEISCSQWEGSGGTQSAMFFFFFLSFGWGRGGFFSFYHCS
jgi:hypothetical protein